MNIPRYRYWSVKSQNNDNINVIGCMQKVKQGQNNQTIYLCVTIQN